MSIIPIEGRIQEEILDMLPDDYHTAIEVMAQLSANLLLSGEKFNIDRFFDRIRVHYKLYIEDEGL